MPKQRTNRFEHGHKFERKDRPRYAGEPYPEARRQGRGRDRGRGRRGLRSPPFPRAHVREQISSRREFENRERFSNRRDIDPRGGNDHDRDREGRNPPVFEEPNRFNIEMDHDIRPYENDRRDMPRRSLLREMDHYENRDARECFQSTSLGHQTLPEEREHFPRDEADRSPSWRSRSPHYGGQETWGDENLGFSTLAERAESDRMEDRMVSPRRPPRDACPSPGPSWWPGQLCVENHVTEMLHACRNEENVPPPPENGAAFNPYIPNFAPYPSDQMADPRQPMQTPLVERLAPLDLETMSEEDKANLAGDILYLLYLLFNEKITPSTMPATTATEPLTEQHTCNQEHMEYGFIPLKVEKDPTSSTIGKDAITAGELHKEIQLHLKVSFPSVKVLCQLLKHYKNIFQVEGSVDTAGCGEDSSHGLDLEDGELPDGEEQNGNSQGDAADDPWLPLIIRAKFDLILCRTHSNKPDTCTPWECQDLHICRHYFLSGRCMFGNRCKFQHLLNSEHNWIALKSRLLHRFRPDTIFELARMVKYRNDSTMPRLCTFYNSGHSDGCKNPRCPYLHVCKRYIQGDCSPVMPCPLSHSLSDIQPRNILMLFGLDFDESQPDVIELIRKVLCKLCMDQKMSFDILRSEKPKSKQVERMLKMAKLKMLSDGALGRKEGVSPEGTKPGPYTWSSKTTIDPTAAVGQWQWQKRSSAGAGDSWSDIASQTELEELYQNFLKAARPCISLNGQRMEVDFLAMTATVDGAETLALQRRPAASSVPDSGLAPSIPETSRTKSPEQATK